MGLIRNKEKLRLEENELRAKVAALSVEQKRAYYAQELQQIKDPDTYAALNWAFVAGLHHFYLGKWQKGLINLTLMIVGVLLCTFTPYTFIGAGLILFVFVIELPQLFNSENVIHHYNNCLIRRLLGQFEHES